MHGAIIIVHVYANFVIHSKQQLKLKQDKVNTDARNIKHTTNRTVFSPHVLIKLFDGSANIFAAPLRKSD